MSALPPELQAHVEAICAEGCNHVRDVIRRLEVDSPPAELGRLAPAARQRILRELQAIMAVYDAR